MELGASCLCAFVVGSKLNAIAEITTKTQRPEESVQAASESFWHRQSPLKSISSLDRLTPKEPSIGVFVPSWLAFSSTAPGILPRRHKGTNDGDTGTSLSE